MDAIFDTIEILCERSSFSGVSVSGFTSNPGTSWLTSVTCNGVDKSASSASFSYSSGMAEWIWSTEFGFAAKISDNVGCSIVHN